MNVIGWLNKEEEEARKFSQTILLVKVESYSCRAFLLTSQDQNRYCLANDILVFQSEDLAEEEDTAATGFQ